MRICFLDVTAPNPYDPITLHESPLGGTEATVIRVAEGLAARGHHVWVAQHERNECSPVGNAVYCGLDIVAPGFDVDVVVSLRTTKLLPFAKKNFPKAKHFLWCHDFNQLELVQDAALLEDVKVLGVSRTHKTIIIEALLSQVRTVPGLTVDFVYNPISDFLAPNDTPRDDNKLVFFSSPHKGLENTFKVFKDVRRSIKGLRLFVANPGYMVKKFDRPKGVTMLGPIPHADMMLHLRQSFAVLHLNDCFPETFGLVHAEAQALGVPVLTASHGANAEILRPSRSQIVDVRDPKAVTERLLKWRAERPQVQCRDEFRLTNVLAKWESLL